MSLFFRLSRLLPAVLLLFASSLVLADPPARVGRLAVVENSVNFRLDRNDQGSPASINWPISSGALLETGRNGRSEVWVGSSAFRLAPDSQLEFPVVDDRQVLLRLNSGSLTVSILDREQSEDILVETPEGRISFASPGRYRIDVLADHSELSAQAGQAAFIDAQRNIAVVAGQKASLYGGGQVRLARDNDQDAFDYWVAERENAALASTTRRYVSPAMTGYQDLDAYGDWNSTSEYGAVWYPRSVADDWAPYRFGRWAWVAPWGWTWVDQSPWGFAPFHYGRWVHVRNRWGWVPGSYIARPVYAPALVAWIGNPGWSVGFRSGAAPAVGWFPLAPREVYVPGFRASAQFVHRINGAHVRDRIEIDRAMHDGPPRGYAYRAQPQAVTVVPASQLREGRPIRGGEFVRPERRDLERAPLARQFPAMPPPAVGRQPGDERRENVPLRSREPDAGRPPGAVNDRRLPEAASSPWPQRDENRRGSFGREPAQVAPARPQATPVQDERRGAPVAAPSPMPAMRDQSPARSPEMPRQEPERRAPPVPASPPLGRDGEAVRPAAQPGTAERGGPGLRSGNDGREERRASPFLNHPQLPPAAREAPRQEGESSRQFEAPRQRDQRPVMPQGAGRDFQHQEMPRPFEAPRPQQPMREQAPAMPQAGTPPASQIRAPAPPPVQAPAREAPRFEAPRPQPQVQQSAPPPRGGQDRRRDGDERGR